MHSFPRNSFIFEQCVRSLQEGSAASAEKWFKGIKTPPPEAAARALWEELRQRIDRALEHQATVDTGRPAVHDDDPTRPATVTIAVVTPTLNIGRYLDETIESVVAQRGRISVHYHVQDAASKDGTVEILKQWERRLGSRKPNHVEEFVFSWASEPDRGLYHGINRGFQHIFAGMNEGDAASAIMTWINGDDLLATRSLWTVARFFAEHPEIHWITGSGGMMDEGGAVIASSNSAAAYSRFDIANGLHDGRSLPFIQQEGTFWRRELWDLEKGIDANAFRLAGDWDLWRRFACRTPLVSIDSELALHRRRAGQLSADMASYHAEIDGRKRKTMQRWPLDDEPGLRAVFDMNSDRWNLIQHVQPARAANDTEPRVREEASGGVAVLADDFHCSTLPSGRPWPRISIVTPSFNQGRYIEETIQSVISQGYPSVQHIVIDAMSTDETACVLDKYEDLLAMVVRESDRGQSDALNKGFRLANGEIFCWLNSDDRLAPGALHAVAMAFDTHDADIVSGICEIYQDGKLLHRHMSACEDGVLPLNILLDLDSGWNTGQFFYQPEVFFTRELWLRAGAHVREDCYYSMDYELWCRFALAEARLHVIGCALARFRVHADQKTSDPSKFKTELISVRDRFIASNELTVAATGRPVADWNRVVRVAMVNDIGLRYGAGIAQGRLAAGIEMAGHEAKIFELSAFVHADGRVDEASLVNHVEEYRPDVVIFGNLHAADRSSVWLVRQLSERYPSFWVTHDFWLFTGRCAYPGECGKYLYGCDATCPTANEYPDLAPDRIRAAWKQKRDLLDLPSAPVILSNSRWSSAFASSATAARQSKKSATVIRPIKLGTPVSVYTRIPKSEARSRFGIPIDQFVVAFSVSSLSERRKGGEYLLEALRDIEIPRLTLLLIGNQDRAIDLEGVSIVSLGYVNDPQMIAAALSAADVYVGPSLAETLGQVFMEAASLGTPSIGFEQSGVVDAIVHDVTGLRVDNSATALRDAIRSMYLDPERCRSLGSWAQTYARNEFCLEASYRSLFNAWQAEGLVNEWRLPHRIGFSRQSQYLPQLPEQGTAWLPTAGVSGEEGPYPPEYPRAFRWCHGRKSTFSVNCHNESVLRLRLVYCCPLFEEMKLDVGCGNLPRQNVTLRRTPGNEPSEIDITLQSMPGWQSVEIVTDRCREATAHEPRELSFIICDVEMLKAPLVESIPLPLDAKPAAQVLLTAPVG